MSSAFDSPGGSTQIAWRRFSLDADCESGLTGSSHPGGITPSAPPTQPPKASSFLVGDHSVGANRALEWTGSGLSWGLESEGKPPPRLEVWPPPNMATTTAAAQNKARVLFLLLSVYESPAAIRRNTTKHESTRRYPTPGRFGHCSSIIGPTS